MRGQTHEKPMSICLLDKFKQNLAQVGSQVPFLQPLQTLASCWKDALHYPLDKPLITEANRMGIPG